MNKKLALLVAGIVAVLAFFGIKSYQKQESDRQQSVQKGVRIVAARDDIKADTEITDKMLGYQEVPEQFVPAQAVPFANKTMLVGRTAKFSINRGKLVLISDVKEDEPVSLSSFIPPHEGAFTITLAKGIRPSLMRNGDHIDIIGSFAAPKPNQPLPTAATSWRQASDMVNVVLLENVTVLAVGDSYSGATGRMDSTGEITVSVQLREAQLLMFAAEHGELGAMLRRQGATEIQPENERTKLSFAEIENIIGDIDHKRNVRLIEVEKGGKTQFVPVMKQ
jgi:Flp pilus assembly protein CpaB